jgi:hypothetical protein
MNLPNKGKYPLIGIEYSKLPKNFVRPHTRTIAFEASNFSSNIPKNGAKRTDAVWKAARVKLRNACDFPRYSR